MKSTKIHPWRAREKTAARMGQLKLDEHDSMCDSMRAAAILKTGSSGNSPAARDDGCGGGGGQQLQDDGPNDDKI